MAEMVFYISYTSSCSLSIGDELTTLVVAVRVVGLEHAQAVANGQAGSHDQESACELLAIGPAHRIDGLPGDQHCHYGGFACTRGKLERQPHQLGIGVIIGIGQVFQKLASGLTGLRCHFRKPDSNFDGFDLTKERPETIELVMAPVLKKADGFRRNMPVIGILQLTPLVYMKSQIIDDRSGIVLLFRGGEPLAFIEDNFTLLGCSLASSWLWDWRDELDAASEKGDLHARVRICLKHLF